MRLKIKVCGMKHPSNIREVSALGPDYLGFIFHPRSPRHCGDMGKNILQNITGDAIPVMVSVNMPEDELLRIVEECGFRVVQLHGDESPELCGLLRAKGLEVWKAIPISTSSDELPFTKTAVYEGAVDMFLFDTATKAYGGSGNKFNWKLLADYCGRTPFMLSGGISPEDASEILSLRHPLLAGVDLNSRFEVEPGLKDATLLYRFINDITKQEYE